MAAPTRQCIVDNDFAFPARWKSNGAAFLWTRRVYFSQYATAGLTANQDFTGFPGFCLIEGAWIVFNQNWTGGAVATATMSLGTTGSPALYAAATTVFSGATTVLPIANVGLTQVPGTFLGTAATPGALGTVRSQLITTVGNTNLLTAGVADIYLRLRFLAFRLK